MKLSKKQTQHIAKLARIKLTEAETAKLQSDLGAALEYVKVLDELDLENTEPTAQVTGLSNVYRGDTAPQECQSLTQKEALSNAPEKRDGFFKVPRVL